MDEKVKKAIEEYQCSGCQCGSDTSCFSKNDETEVGCGKHHAGTFMTGVGKLFLGMPKGFNRVGHFESMKINIFEKFEGCDWEYNMWNIPCWKFKNEFGHTIVRGLMPRRNEPFLHIYLEDCLDKINCLEITQKDVEGMD
jgi:hypothetical protein